MTGGTGAPARPEALLAQRRGKMPHPRKRRRTFWTTIAGLPEVRLPAAPRWVESGRNANIEPHGNRIADMERREGGGWEDAIEIPLGFC